MPKWPVRGFLVLLLAGCEERDRLTFPSGPGVGTGPVTTIDDPSVDTVVTQGALVIVGGRTVDADGVDTLYFELTGSGQGFLPARGHGEDTVIFGLPIQTTGLGQATVTVRVRAVDILGNQGETATRQLTIE